VSTVSYFKALPFILLLLAAACAESAGVAPGAAPPRPALDEDDLWSMIPAEADLVMWADMARLRVSPWTRDSFAKVANGDDAADGGSLDHMRDLDRVVFAKVPTFSDGASILVAQAKPGKLDRARMAKTFTKGQQAGATTYRGAELWSRGAESLAFVGKGTVISGLTVAVRAAIDCNFGVGRSIETESWFARMRADLLRGRDAASLVAALYVHLQPATREALVQQMGEGGTLEEFAGRVDLADDLDATVIGVVRTEGEARDLAARLNERIRDARVRPIVAAFGFGSVLDSVQFRASDTRVQGALHVSEKERAEIAQRMAVVADTMANLRKESQSTPPNKEDQRKP
jgi:hypothetical protein